MEIYLEPDVDGNLVQDCEVCCNPWEVNVWDDGENRHVSDILAETHGGDRLAIRIVFDFGHDSQPAAFAADEGAMEDIEWSPLQGCLPSRCHGFPILGMDDL